jgi:hypothetical protein
MVVVTAKSTATANAQAQTQANHQKRVQQQQEIKNLTEQQWSQIAIAQTILSRSMLIASNSWSLFRKYSRCSSDIFGLAIRL